MPEFLAIHGDRVVTRDEMADLQRKAVECLARMDTGALHAVDPIETLACVFSAAAGRRRLVLIPGNYSATDAVMMAREAGALALDAAETSTQLSGGADGWLGLFTSGTTGAPKLVIHDWERVQKPAEYVRDEMKGKAWLSTYSYASYAGLQVLFSAINSGGSIVFAAPLFEDTCRLMVRHNVSIVSATPTYWRMLITSWPEDLQKPVLEQATFGGEGARQDMLDLVKDFFHPKRVTHIYASTEVGPALTVSDGHEGFPASWLQKKGPVEVRIVNGVLEFKSDYAMRGYGGDLGQAETRWIRTADFAEVRGDRIIITGRNDGVINVGGAKVSPEMVEDEIMRVPGVSDCRVYRKSNPITGYLLAADVLPDKDTTLISAEVTRALRERLPSTHVPAMVRIVNAIPITPAGKKSRVDE